MKRILILVVVAMMTMMTVNAQSLAGRTYHNANILAGEMNKKLKEVDQKIPEIKAKGYAKFEEKNGRKPTAAEKAKLEKELNESVAQAKAVAKGMTTAITVEFKTEKNAVMKADMKVSDDAMKAAGIGWLKRKAMKAALAVAPSSSKATYVVKGDLIILDDGEEKDTLRLSSDGKYLYGKFEKDVNFKLTRTK
ncbi:MAG: hypothetical protein J5658_01355 [Prevotella sp.]|nr:hypothetical protein [Prevotella sp.]